MKKNKILDFDSLGPVLFEKSARARRMSISVRPFKGVRVAVPRSCTYGMAEAFVRCKADWILKSQLKMRRLEAEQNERKSRVVEPTGREKRAARESLVQRLEYLSKWHGFTYNRVFVRNQKTLWGSCSFKNNINLNIKLLELPVELSDYVIIHELVHTRIKSHSVRFWNELNRYVPDARAVDKRLKKYSLAVL